MINSDVSLPGAFVAAVLVIGGLSVAVAPEVGQRLARNSGAIEACEKGLLKELEAAAKREANAIETPPAPNIDLGAVFGGLLGGRPGSEAYMERYGPQFKNLGDAITAPMRQQAEQAREVARRKIEAIEAQFRKDAATGASQCECRAIAAVNKGHTSLAVFTASGGLVAWPPVGNFPAAMSDPTTVAECRGVS